MRLSCSVSLRRGRRVLPHEPGAHDAAELRFQQRWDTALGGGHPPSHSRHSASNNSPPSKFDIATYLADQNSRELHTMQGAASTAQTVTNVVAGTNSSANAREKSLATWFQIALARKMKSPGWVCKIHPPHTGIHGARGLCVTRINCTSSVR